MNRDEEKGFKNFYYAVRTSTGTGTPVPMPGAIKISVKPQTENRVINIRRSDGTLIQYTEGAVETGKTATVDIINLPVSFLTDILGYTIDENGVLIEHEQQAKHFVLLYENTRNGEAVRHQYTDCVCSKPNFDVTTITSEAGIDKKSLELILNPDIFGSGGYSKSITESQNPEIFAKWFDKVY